MIPLTSMHAFKGMRVELVVAKFFGLRPLTLVGRLTHVDFHGVTIEAEMALIQREWGYKPIESFKFKTVYIPSGNILCVSEASDAYNTGPGVDYGLD